MRPRRRKYAPDELKPPRGEVKPEHRVTLEEIRLVAAAVLSPQDWFSRFGESYGISSADRVRELCASSLKNKRRSHCQILPAGWHCTRNGYRLFIYRSNNSLPPGLSKSRRPTLPPHVHPETVERVFTTLFTAIEWLTHVGTPTYGFNEISYVVQMFRGRPWGNSKLPATLPPGWNSMRFGRSFLAFHSSLISKELWIKFSPERQHGNTCG